DVTPSDPYSQIMEPPFGVYRLVSRARIYRETSTSPDGFNHSLIPSMHSITPFIQSIILFASCMVRYKGYLINFFLVAGHAYSVNLVTSDSLRGECGEHLLDELSCLNGVLIHPQDPSSNHIPPLPATSPFLSSIDDSSDSDIPDTPSSPTYVYYSSLDHFSSDDSLRDSSSSSSSESSSDSSSDALSDSASSHDIETVIEAPMEVEIKITHLVVAEDIPEPAQEGAVEVTYKTYGYLVQRFHDHTQEIPVRRIQVIESVQRDQENMECSNWDSKIMPNTQSGASRTREGINEPIDHQLLEHGAQYHFARKP
ncbi:hypothetical protein Tco_1114422, partial [Tanacetum coccineum]